MRISDWSSDVCSSDLPEEEVERVDGGDIAGGLAVARVQSDPGSAMEGDAARRYRDKAVEDLDRGARGGDHQAARRNIIIPYRNIAEAVQLPALGRRDAAASCQQPRGYPLNRSHVGSLPLGCDQTPRSEEHTSELQPLMR